MTKLAAFTQNNPEYAAELVANGGLIHLYRQNDFTTAQNILAQLQTLAQNGDTMAVEHVKLFGRILQDYQRHRQITSAGLQKQVAAASQTLTPATIALAQNYPNPFSASGTSGNSETVIRFHLSERQQVRLVIYDLSGKRVRTLVEGELPAGEQTVSWDGRRQNGQTVASGVYFYELVVGNNTEKRKMTLIR